MRGCFCDFRLRSLSWEGQMTSVKFEVKVKSLTTRPLSKAPVAELVEAKVLANSEGIRLEGPVTGVKFTARISK